MDVMEAIYTRRAVRSYLPDGVDEVLVRRLLEAATQAPSAMNGQPWCFAVVQDKTRLARYSERAKTSMLIKSEGDPKAERYRPMLMNPSFNIFYDAGTLIVICADTSNRYAQADCWLAAQNLQLAAVSQGLGTCCIGFAIDMLNAPEIKSELGVGADQSAVAALIVGKPTTQPSPVPRKAPHIASWLR